ncbi:uncharacterized protein LOC106664481 [Cimex lectularius]|uniref:CPR type cuticle protein n=1 Tax=Cimex lectularius TaxID=79782 RepID=A0A8I6RKN7_CIMLE|nr:uncharacterized protein LOC106664481 [Cimex lectularius]
MRSFVFLISFGIAAVLSHPTVYAKNDQDRLSPVLLPISSTVIPLPIYKVSYSLGGSSDDGAEFKPGNTKLITAKTQKVNKGKVKAISREKFEKGI